MVKPHPLLPLTSAILGALGRGSGDGGGTNMADNLLINLSGISCFQPLGEGGPVRRRVPRLLPYEEVWDDGPVK